MAKLTIRFEIQKDKINKDGKAPITCLISISQRRKRMPTKTYIQPVNWDSKTKRAIYISKTQHSKMGLKTKYSAMPLESDINKINTQLLLMDSRLKLIEDDFKLNDKPYTVDDIYEQYQDKFHAHNSKNVEKVKKTTVPTVPEFIDAYIERNRPNRAKRSLGVYSQLKNHLVSFENYSGKKVTFDCIGLSFFEEFNSFLIEVKTNLNNITIAKQLSTLKTLLGYARKHGIIMDQSFRDFTIKKQKLEVITLTESEYQSLKTVNLKGVSRHEKARDIFIFLCATSMRFSDYNQFKREHIKGSTIQMTMKKGSKPWEIPLNPDSLSILDKYKGLSEPLPKISNQKLSKYIKEICEIAEINDPIEIVRYRGAEPIIEVFPKFKLISAHTGRKTFCTLSLERGASVETVMKWSGHESYSSFKRYVNLSRTHSISEMERVWGNTPIMKAV